MAPLLLTRHVITIPEQSQFGCNGVPVRAVATDPKYRGRADQRQRANDAAPNAPDPSRLQQAEHGQTDYTSKILRFHPFA